MSGERAADFMKSLQSTYLLEDSYQDMLLHYDIGSLYFRKLSIFAKVLCEQSEFK